MHVMCMSNLASLRWNSGDHDASYRLYLHAAAEGCAVGGANLALCHLLKTGLDGTCSDAPLALALLYQAAEMGNEYAMLKLAEYFQNKFSCSGRLDRRFSWKVLLLRKSVQCGEV
eukprot:TRINITY_DN3590_c0_g1_i4.p2 TRINITY_DN3590_c0_g1~~TRINITY_DN3590_c0_g1_i4.p2  ORF type:complete len:115 (-),score=29.50 TRINITY_DN3590_c0_g1_i4:61-405(-)